MIAAGGKPETIRTLALPASSDLIPGEGPLSGLLGALDHLETTGGPNAVSRHTATVVMAACDLPGLSAGPVLALLKSLANVAFDAATPMVGGRHQWSLVAMRTTITPQLRERFAGGERSMRGAFSDISLAEVTLEGDSMADVDTAQEWERFLRDHR